MSEDKGEPFKIDKPNVRGVVLPPRIERALESDLNDPPEDAIFNRLTDAVPEAHARSKWNVSRAADTIGTVDVINVGGEGLGEEEAIGRLVVDMNSLAEAGVQLDEKNKKVLENVIPVRDPANLNYAVEHKVAGDVVDRVRRVVKGLTQKNMTEHDIFERMVVIRKGLGIQVPIDNPEEVTRQIKMIVDISKPPRPNL